MILQYALRRDAEGWTVFDCWTGETVVLGLHPQRGLSASEADELVKILNRRGLEGDRSILQ
jgi:hypothetical protein